MPDGVVPTASLRAQARAWRAGFAVLVGDDAERLRHGKGVRELSHVITGPRERARAQSFVGFALFGVGHQATSEALIERALEGYGALGDDWSIAAALSVRANQAHARGDLDRPASDGHRRAELFTQLG